MRGAPLVVVGAVALSCKAPPSTASPVREQPRPAVDASTTPAEPQTPAPEAHETEPEFPPPAPGPVKRGQRYATQRGCPQAWEVDCSAQGRVPKKPSEEDPDPCWGGTAPVCVLDQSKDDALVGWGWVNDAGTFAIVERLVEMPDEPADPDFGPPMAIRFRVLDPQGKVTVEFEDGRTDEAGKVQGFEFLGYDEGAYAAYVSGVTGGGGKPMKVVDLARGVHEQLPVRVTEPSVLTHDSGRWLAYAGDDDTVYCFDLQRMQQEAIVEPAQLGPARTDAWLSLTWEGDDVVVRKQQGSPEKPRVTKTRRAQCPLVP